MVRGVDGRRGGAKGGRESAPRAVEAHRVDPNPRCIPTPTGSILGTVPCDPPPTADPSRGRWFCGVPSGNQPDHPIPDLP